MKNAVFLDRDGVINEVLTKRVKFVNKPSQFHLLEGVGEAIRKLNDADFLVFVVTNQGGVGLGFMKESALKDVHSKMVTDLSDFGASIDDIAYCIHKPKEGCECRKPKPNMIIDLANKHEIDLKNSYMIGDRDIDIIAGKNAGTTTILIGDDTEIADNNFSNLFEAANWIVAQVAG